jgi:SdiA-regulated
MKACATSILWLLLTGALLTGCKGIGKSIVPSIPGYDASLKKTILLHKDLVEISGIFYLPDGRLAAINDEEGKIFLVNNATGEYVMGRFGKKRDYEDVVKADSFFYVLESNGNIHQVPEGIEEQETEFEFPREKYIEFESLYYDKPENRLVLVAKEQRKAKKSINAYTFNLLTKEFSADPLYSISLDEVHTRMKNTVAEFKPSAAAIHPITHKLFILASVGKALLQCSPDGKVEELYHLNPDEFPQPEGITFAPNGDMFISNEGLNGKASIVEFPYHK